MGRWEVEKLEMYLGRSYPHSIPVYTRQDVDQELGVVGDVALLELGVFVVQRKAQWRRFAGLDGAGEEGCC